MKKHLLFALLLLMTAALQAQVPGDKPAAYTLKIKYLFEANLSPALDDFANEYEEGKPYSVVSPDTIVGYHPNKAVVEGIMPDHDLVDTVLYRAETFTVTTQSEPEEGGTTSGGGTYNYGDDVTVTAEANEGSNG